MPTNLGFDPTKFDYPGWKGDLWGGIGGGRPAGPGGAGPGGGALGAGYLGGPQSNSGDVFGNLRKRLMGGASGGRGLQLQGSEGWGPWGTFPGQPPSAPGGGGGGAPAGTPSGVPGSDWEGSFKRLIQQLIGAGIGSGAFSPLGSSGLLDVLSQRGRQDARAGQRQAVLGAELSAGDDPLLRAFAGSEAMRTGQSSLANSLQQARLQSILQNQGFLQGVLGNNFANNFPLG